MHLYDSRTGKPIRPAADKLRWAEGDVRYDERHLDEATAYDELTFWGKSRASFWTMWVSGAVAIGFGLLQLRDVWAQPGDSEGAWLGLAVFAIISVLAAVCVLEKISDHRTGAAAAVRYQQGQYDSAVKRASRLKVEAEAELAAEHAEQERLRNAPTAEQMLSLFLTTAARDTTAINDEAPTWARALADTYSDEAWTDLAKRQGWDADLARKIRSTAPPVKPAPKELDSEDVQMVGWAG
ncbi:hypothetical protein [Frigoribacterium sp. SL97]|uniref:hypothetical protein n=1 Tax=Frigoribacterium sp. SL97 TaxID=2994664 RepID=UPI00226DE3B2|nr:hypothetical protein [Frigoribacterium sp. SL97]WAC50534.1 hypothetical protein OVA02_11690 [Frigoribacterium sp. SL97]